MVLPFPVHGGRIFDIHGGSIFGKLIQAALFLTSAKMGRRHFFQLNQAAELTFTQTDIMFGGIVFPEKICFVPFLCYF